MQTGPRCRDNAISNSNANCVTHDPLNTRTTILRREFGEQETASRDKAVSTVRQNSNLPVT